MQRPDPTNRFWSKPSFPVAGLNGTNPLTPSIDPPVPQNNFPVPYAIGAAYLFLLFSHATEFIDTQGRFHLVVIVALAAMIAAFTAGKVPSVFSSRPGLSLGFFTAFLILSIPFSSWKGNSFHHFVDSWWKSYIAFFLVGSLIFTTQQIRRSLFLLGLGTVGIIYFSFKATKMNDDGRMSVEYGSLGNSNDLAGALLMGLPFLLYVVLDKKRSALVRLSFLALTGILLLVVFKTGSRSGLLAMAFMAILFFFKIGAGNKAKLLVACTVVAAILPLVAGNTLMARYKTMFKTSITENMSDDAASAVMSTRARRQLVINAIELTIRHPVFGVGLGNFSDQSAALEISKGNKPLWFTSHDIYLLVSSETGVIGILLYLATIFFTFGTLLRIGRTTKHNPNLESIGNMSFCLFMSLAAFAACGLFSTNAYTAQLPLLAGLTVALDRITKPILALEEGKRLENFRQSIPVRPSKYAESSSAALSAR